MPSGTDRAALRIDDPRVSERVQRFPESVIREMTRIAAERGAINLAQGYPDFDPPAELLAAARAALGAGHNQYSVTWGAPELREAIARKARSFNGIDADPDRNVVVTCGATEAMMAAMLALVNPGEEVVVLEPFYENYGPDAIVSGATARPVRLEPPDWTLSEEALKAAFTRRTKAIVVNTPNNPTGRVLTRDELGLIADLCEDSGAVAVTDEIYEHIVFDGRRHISLATVGDMADRTVTINGVSKTYSATGWRVGWAIAPAPLAAAMRRAHDFLTVCAPHAFQVAAVAALGFPPRYYEALARGYEARRDRLVGALTELGFDVPPPEGTYYVLADARRFGRRDDWALAMELVERGGVASVPGSSFFADPSDGRPYLRFVFCKQDTTLDGAIERLRAWAPGRPRPSAPPAGLSAGAGAAGAGAAPPARQHRGPARRTGSRR